MSPQIPAAERGPSEGPAAASSAEQLRHSQRLEAIGRLTGGVAHDFNNMLTAIRGYSHLLLEGLEDNDELRPLAEQIDRACEQATTLPRQLLAFSRRQTSDPVAVDLNAVLVATTDMLGHLVGEKIELTVQPHASSAWVSADPGSLEQVILNLAVNAGEAMPGGGKLTLSTWDAPREGATKSIGAGEHSKYVALAVSDEGEGMAPETKARAHEPFFTTKQSGSGLGLATVYGIVSQSGGFVAIDSERGRGTVVEVRLPCVDSPARSSELREVDLREPSAPAGTVLLVEDEGIVRDLALTVLNRGGYHVLTAANGEEALQLLARTEDHIDVLVTDMVMPGIDGRELAKRAVAVRPSSRVLMMSGYAPEAPATAAAAEDDALPGRRFLEKPFTPSALLRAVRELVEQSPSSTVGGARAGARITCVVADDHAAVLDAVTRYLEHNGMDVIASVSRGEEALEAILLHSPSVALLDERMQQLTGVEVARRAALSGSATACVLYTGHSDGLLLKQALDAGARGFVRKEAPLAELLQALRAVASGGTYIDSEMAGDLATGANAKLTPLTDREQQVLRMVADGMTNEKAAAALGISPETIQSHIRNTMTKLGSETRTQAVATAFRRSLLV
jgi:DNA-binding NarL/FixJ family response regulator